VVYTNIDGFITLQMDNKTTNEQVKKNGGGVDVDVVVG
jgi:hypothetical protein